MNRQIYCTVDTVVADLDMGQDFLERDILNWIGAACKFVEREIGQFFPITETRKFRGRGSDFLTVYPLLSVTTLTIDGDEIAEGDFLLYPDFRYWFNGPYSKIVIDPDAYLTGFINEVNGNVVAGTWGLYDLTDDTGATATQADAVVVALVVDDASEISPGAVLLIEDEQQYVTGRGAVSDSSTTTDGTIPNDRDLTLITVVDGTKINAGEVIKIDSEKFMVRLVDGNDLHVYRAYWKTPFAQHASGATVSVYRTFIVERGVNGTTAAAHTSKAVSVFVPPEDINFLARELSALKRASVQTGFAQRSGSAAFGDQVFYDQFPTKSIKRIKRNYTRIGIS